jgi:hypothetical protein
MNDTNSRLADRPGQDQAAPEAEGTAALAVARGAVPEPGPEQRGATEPSANRAEEPAAPLFGREEAGGLRAKWDDVQTGFVDEPRKAVEQADSLVAAATQRLAEIFAEERSTLEGQWGRGDDVSTEDLRLALRRYRSFFTRLLSV